MTPGKRPKGTGNLLANRELMAKFENHGGADKPPEPQVPRKKWTPPPKPETEYQKAAQSNSGRMPWDPPMRKSSWEQKPPTSPDPKIVLTASPTPKLFANEASGKEEEDSPKSRLSDNPFMRRDSKEGMSPRSPTNKQDAYPVISTVERPSPEKVVGPALPSALTCQCPPAYPLSTALLCSPPRLHSIPLTRPFWGGWPLAHTVWILRHTGS